MVIFTNCLSETADEGCLKVANSLIKRIKKASPDVTVVSYERKSGLSDVHVKSNKLLLTWELIKTLRSRNEEVLFIPFPAKSSAMFLRILILSLIAPKKTRVLLTQITEIGAAARVFARLCNAEFLVLSETAKGKLEGFIKPNRIKRIRAGVDTERFVPAEKHRVAEIKRKYGFSPDRPVVLHVGHMNEGRNISELMKFSEEYQIVLVTSTLTKNEEDKQLKAKLSGCSNIKIIDKYIPEISEIYQMADVYFFPVVEEGNCIDVPLSCLEAAACNKPVVTTEFGEMKEFKGKGGFFFIDSFEPEELEGLINEALECGKEDIRSAVSHYDWNCAVNSILNF